MNNTPTAVCTGYVRRYLDGLLALAPGQRLLAVDALRGLAVAGMILVNNPGSWAHAYAPLLHAQWHGWTPTDIIFPLFLFIVGTSLVLSLQAVIAQPQGRGAVYRKILVRVAKLFGLGLFLALFYYNFFDPDFSWWRDRFSEVRIMGVLQRIALVFLCCAFVLLSLRQRGIVALTVLLLAGYAALLLWVPYRDGSGTLYCGVLEHGNSITAWLDAQVFAPQHVYYPDTRPFHYDPEGLLSTLGALASGLLGVLAGFSVLALRTGGRLWPLALWGVVGVAAAYLVAPLLPINKTLWTPSYVLLMAGISSLLLCLFLFLTEVVGWVRWTVPLVVCGVNAIAFYMFSGVLARLLLMIPIGDINLKAWLYNTVYAPLFGPTFGSLMFAVSTLAVCYAVMEWMYRRQIFWKV